MRSFALITLISALGFGSTLLAAPGDLGAFTRENSAIIKQEMIGEKLPWLNKLDNALGIASEEYRPIIVFFYSPTNGWCSRMRAQVFSDEAVKAQLKHYVRVQVTIEDHPGEARQYMIRSIPTILILSADGRVQRGREGFVGAPELVKILRSALNSEFLKKTDPQFKKIVLSLEENAVKKEAWAGIMLALGQNEKRETLRQLILKLNPFPRSEFVGLLSDSRLAVRLGALETLEELAGDHFGFEPWAGDVDRPENKIALERWTTWAGKAGEEGISKVFSLLTDAQIAKYIRDMIGDNRTRAVRASTMLRNGGKNVARSLQSFLAQNDDLPVSTRNSVSILFYTLTMPPLGSHDPDTLARRLVSGNLDAKLETLTVLKDYGRAAMPILADFMNNHDPLIRETAVDAILNAGRSFAIGPVAQHLKTEKDNDVIMAALRSIAVAELKDGAKISARYVDSEEEDLSIMALESLAALRATDQLKLVQDQLKDDRWRVRVAALEALGKFKSMGDTKVVRPLLMDKDEFVRIAAVQTIAALGDARAKDDLLKLYDKDEDARGPVIQALISMKLGLPESLKKDLAASSPSAILFVIDAVGHSREKHLDLIEDFTTHPDQDVSCAALRQIAEYGMANGQYQTLVSDALKEGVAAKVIAATESIHLSDEQYKTWQAAGSASTSSQISSNPLVDEIYDIFLGRKKTAPDSNAPEDPLDDLFTQLKKRLAPGESDSIRAAAALIMAKAGDQQAIDLLLEGTKSRSVSQRSKVASSLRSAPEAALPVLLALMRDRSSEVREAAANAILSHEEAPEFTDAFFKEATRIQSVIKPWEVDIDYLKSSVSEGDGKSIASKYAHEILANSLDPQLQSLAIITLRYAWKYGDEKALLPFTTSENPWLRRAAWIAIGKNQKNILEKNASSIAADSSEKVRAVLPFLLGRSGRYWVHYFDQEHNQRYYDYDSGSYRSNRRVSRFSEPIKEALVKLSTDSSPAVRVDSSFLLLAHGEKLDAAALEASLSEFPDRESIRTRVSDYLEENYTKLDQDYRFLTNHIDPRRISASTLKQIYAHFKINPNAGAEDDFTWVEKKAGPGSLGANPTPPGKPGAGGHPADQAKQIELLFFHNPGCKECERVEKFLAEMKVTFPRLKIVKYNIRESAAARLNEALCEKFGVPEKIRMVTPAVFTGDGYLIKDDILPLPLGDLIVRSNSAENSAPGWSSLAETHIDAAGTAIEKRFSSVGLMVILSAGFLDGINPCAFATIILFLSYLQIARHGPRQILMVGTAFITAVFLTYFALGLGLVEVISRLRFLQGAGIVLNWILALFALLIMVLSFRDGVLCLQGRLADTALQLPAFLKERIRKVARRGARHRRFVIAAFISGVVISVLELACTGQVYLPTINYMLQSGKKIAYAYLLLYNLAFILPLLAIFIFAYFGLRSDSLIAFQKKHSALIKFATAALFLVLFLVLIFQ